MQFEHKAQALLNNPLYAEKPKLDKSLKKASRFKVRYLNISTVIIGGMIEIGLLIHDNIVQLGWSMCIKITINNLSILNFEYIKTFSQGPYKK